MLGTVPAQLVSHTFPDVDHVCVIWQSQLLEGHADFLAIAAGWPVMQGKARMAMHRGGGKQQAGDVGQAGATYACKKRNLRCFG